MRCFFLFLFITFFSPSPAQEAEFFISDTSKVAGIFSSSKIIPDSVFYIKDRKLIKGSYIIYYDSARKQKYLHNVPGDTGSFTTWYRNGQVSEIVKRNGIKLEIKGWYADGSIKIQKEFRGDSSITFYYYRNGRLLQKDVSILDKKLHSYNYRYYEKWCENGQLIIKSENLSSPHVHTEYYCNGFKKRELHTMGWSLYYGPVKEWYENGKLRMEGQFTDLTEKDIKGGFRIGGETGTWKYYNEDGQLEKERIYQNGEIIKEIKY